MLYLEPTSRTTFWRRPEIARLLMPVESRGSSATKEPRSAAEYLSAIERSVRDARPSSPVVGGELLAAAREAVAALRRLDEQKARLSSDADPAEATRLGQKLEALGPEADGEGEARRQLRGLLGQQLEVLEGVQSRLEEHAARQTALLAALRDVWRGATEGPGAAGDRLPALGAELQKQASAADLVDLPTLPR